MLDKAGRSGGPCGALLRMALLRPARLHPMQRHMVDPRGMVCFEAFHRPREGSGADDGARVAQAGPSGIRFGFISNHTARGLASRAVMARLGLGTSGAIDHGFFGHWDAPLG